MSVGWQVALLLLVVLQRLAELVHARHNAARMIEAGGREIGAGHYPLFIVLHAAWLGAMALGLHPLPAVPWALLVAYAGLQLLRLWTIASLGQYWTTRIVTIDGAPLSRRGPYRLLRHPNYAIVAVEIPLLPAALGQPGIALAFGALNLALLAYRIGIEDRALAARRRPVGTNAD